MAVSTAATPSAGPARVLARALLATAIAVPLIAWGLDRSMGREVLLIAPHEAAVVALNRSLWAPGEPVAELYGSPLSAPVRVLVGDESALLRPVEDPALTLLPTGPGRPHPFQARTLRLLARLAAFALAAAGIAALLVHSMMLRRSAASGRHCPKALRSSR